MDTFHEFRIVGEERIHLDLPEKFRGKQVEIIVRSVPTQSFGPKRKKSLRGCLGKYANPELIDRESEAWHKTIEDKYGSR